ncbi:MAG: hypothetical protein QM680_07385 [Luteolibacter sp.]
MIRIEINTDNAAFDPDGREGWRSETAWILHDLADRILTGHALPIVLRDYNGNRVGKAVTDPSKLLSATASERETA